jgi:hypothetical protein
VTERVGVTEWTWLATTSSWPRSVTRGVKVTKNVVILGAAVGGVALSALDLAVPVTP